MFRQVYGGGELALVFSGLNMLTVPFVDTLWLVLSA
jgi:hypothetical protein